MKKKLKAYPTWVCQECALANGGRLFPNHVSTIHKGRCGICKKMRWVTQPRDYGYPQFKGHK